MEYVSDSLMSVEKRTCPSRSSGYQASRCVWRFKITRLSPPQYIAQLDGPNKPAQLYQPRNISGEDLHSLLSNHYFANLCNAHKNHLSNAAYDNDLLQITWFRNSLSSCSGTTVHRTAYKQTTKNLASEELSLFFFFSLGLFPWFRMTSLCI